MGTECIGKSPRAQRNNHFQIQSTTTKEHTPQNMPKLPELKISTHRPTLYPLYNHFQLSPDLSLYHQCRYQDYLQFKSFNSNSRFKQQPQPGQGMQKDWGVCTTLNRDLWQQMGKRTLLTKTGSYVEMSSNHANQSSKLMEEKGESKKISFQFLPEKVVLLEVQLSSEDKFSVRNQLYDIKTENDLISIISKSVTAKPELKHVKTNFVSGFLCHSREDAKQAFSHCILDLLNIKIKAKTFTLILYPNRYPIEKEQSRKASAHFVPLTYWQASMWIKQRVSCFWNCNFIDIQSKFGPELSAVFLAFQMLRSCIDSLQHHYFEDGLYLSQSRQLSQKRIKYLTQFLLLGDKVLKEVLFVSNIFLALQNYSNIQQYLRKVVQCLAFEIPTVAEGLFCQFGLEINQKEHPFKNDSYHFLKLKARQEQRPVIVIKKDWSPPNTNLICLLASSMHFLCQLGDGLTQQLIATKNKEVLRVVNQYFSDLESKQESVHFQDYLLRISLLQHLICLTRETTDSGRWKKIVEQFQNVDLVTLQTAFLYLALCALGQSASRGCQQSSEQQKKAYLKALQIGLKLFGDPRTSNQGRRIKLQSIWLLYFLENYRCLYVHSTDKLEYNFLKNLIDCLKQDLRPLLPPKESSQNQQYNYSFTVLINNLPAKRFSGCLIRRAEISDIDKEASRSNYSEYGSSNSFKRINKSFYRVSQWQFGLKTQMSGGALMWGQSVPSPPQPMPSLKKFQVLTIAAGNYHVVFLTEEGLFGWGENSSGQLGRHNHQKVYRKAVKIQSLSVNRHHDKYQISCGNEHTALLLNCQLRMWGQQSNGITAGVDQCFDQIACGGLHTLGLRNGKVLSWGRGEGGQLGHPVSALKQQQRQQTTLYYLDTPTEIKPIDKAIKVACGDAHSLILTAQGRVWVFGFSYQGQLGLGLTGDSETFQIFQPMELIAFKEAVCDLWAGPTSSFFKTVGGEVFSCGYNDCLQLGIDRVLKILQKKKYLHRVVDLNKKKLGEQEFSKPRKLDIFSKEMGLKLLRLECGENHCLALAQYQSNEKLLIGWGLNKHNQLDYKMGEVIAPRTLDVLHSVDIREFSCGSTFSLAVVGDLPMTFNETTRLIEDIFVRCCGAQL